MIDCIIILCQWIYRNRKVLILKAYKYVAVLAFLLSFGHVFLLLCGVQLHIAEKSVYVGPLATLSGVGLSYVLRYCFIHRGCILYTGIISWCIHTQQYGPGFGPIVDTLRLLALAAGVLLLYLIIHKKIQCEMLHETH